MALSQEARSLLTRAKKILEKQDAWTRGVLARDARGVQVWFEEKEACCFCIGGAIRKARQLLRTSFEAHIEAAAAVTSVILEETKSKHKKIATYNDDPKTTHKMVLSLFDKTLAGA